MKKVYSYGTVKQIDIEANLQRLKSLYGELEELQAVKVAERVKQRDVYMLGSLYLQSILRHKYRAEQLEELERFLEDFIDKLKNDLRDSLVLL